MLCVLAGAPALASAQEPSPLAVKLGVSSTRAVRQGDNNTLTLPSLGADLRLDSNRWFGGALLELGLWTSGMQGVAGGFFGAKQKLGSNVVFELAGEAGFQGVGRTSGFLSSATGQQGGFLPYLGARFELLLTARTGLALSARHNVGSAQVTSEVYPWFGGEPEQRVYELGGPTIGVHLTFR